MSDLLCALQQHEAELAKAQETIAEQGTTISVLDGDLQNAKCDLAAAQATIQQRERELEHHAKAVMRLIESAHYADAYSYLEDVFSLAARAQQAEAKKEE